jgi:hypothetical protein
MALSIAIQSIAVFMLSLTINKHFKSMFGQPPTSNLLRGLIVCGWGLLLFSLYYLVLRSTFVGLSLVWWLSYLSTMIFIAGVIHSRR